MRKVYLEAKIEFVLRLDDFQDIDEAVNQIQWNAESGIDTYDVENVEISDVEVVDSK